MKNKLLGLNKFELNTPCLVIDKKKLIHNLSYMQELAKNKNVLLRPHTKTHKCSKIATLQLEHGAIGVCVAKVSEAYVMAKNGISSILITSPLVALNKIDILLDVLHLAPDTMLVIDNLANAQQLNKILKENNLVLNILLDIDGGIGRTGVHLTDAINMIKGLRVFSNLTFRGIQCYAGHLQHITEINERRQKSHEVLANALKIKDAVIAEGIDCAILTGSGTGSFSLDAEINGVTEVQPGSYVVMDQEYNNIKYKEQAFLTAMTLLTTVISTNHDTHVTVDAGTKAMYRVTALPEVISHPHLIYDWNGFGDEHGKVTKKSQNHPLPKLGEVLELRVGHCDPTINLYDQFIIVENDLVVDVWDIDARGCCV